ncbi:cancer/testis antigen 2-like isoform X1 [Piliocolobus tephrosceles]|uniref:Cancer/testis antigen 1-like n=1 Tax=Piliocolobus tephrosceles TaxID=591936 RepID=A0A8C9GM50_9PRIM|nr:cancer/testis antigen 2-like isoform X1 [Piliocolobus tephrosceles]
MQAAGQGTGGTAGDADGPGGPGVPGGPGGDAGGPREAGAADDRGPQGAGAARASGPGRVSGPGGGVPRGPRGGPASRLNGCCRCGTRRPDSRLLEFYLTMPFPTPMEAELAQRSLARDAPPLPVPGVLLKEFTVSGNILTMSVQDQDRDGAWVGGVRSVAGGGWDLPPPHGQVSRDLGTPQHRVSEQRPGTPGPPPPEGARGDGCGGVAFNLMFFAPHI